VVRCGGGAPAVRGRGVGHGIKDDGSVIQWGDSEVVQAVVLDGGVGDR
jgi:hypothetical protein